jgi:P27 family predicted phage terminase small subunit
MPGPNRDPRRARRRTGHHRPTSGVPVVRDVPLSVDPELKPPRHLSREQKAVWRSLVAVASGFMPLRPADALILEALVTQYVRTRQLAELIDRHGLVHGTQTGMVTTSSFVRAEREAATLLLRMAKEFGLTLASRVNLGFVGLAGKSLLQSLNEELHRD